MIRLRYIFIILVFLPLYLFAQEVYELDPRYPVHDLNSSLLIVEDIEKALKPNDLLKGELKADIKYHGSQRALKSKVTYWGILKIRPLSDLNGWTLHFRDKRIGIPAWVKSNGKVDVFGFLDNKLIFNKKTGVEVPKNERDVKQKWVLNRIKLDDIPANQVTTLVIKVEGTSLGYPAFFNLSSRSPEEPFYHEIYQFNNSFNLFVLGVFFIITLYHLLQYFYVKETVFLYFSIWSFICMMTMWMSVGGLIGSITDYRFSLWTIIANSIFWAFWFFGRTFIQSQEKFPLIDKLILGMAIFMILFILSLCILVEFFDMHPWYLRLGYQYYILSFYSFCSVILSVILIFQKDNFARYFGAGSMIGMTLLLIGNLWSGYIIKFPGFDPYAWGMFLKVVIFSFGIAYRQRILMLRYTKQQMEAQKNMAEARRIKDLDEIKSKFFANVSHEFRTPLSLILGPLEHAVENKISGRSNYHIDESSYHIVKRNAERLQGLVDQLLDLSRLESGHVYLSLTHGDLIQFLKAIVFSFESMAERNAINFNTNFPSDIDYAFFDKDKLEKIVSNLITNAIKFTPANGTVTVGVVGKVGWIHIEVTDTGKGIRNHDLKRIFDRFYRVEGSEEKGSGIGLALTKELVEFHNGQINVSSTLGVGTTFKIKLPISLMYLPENNYVLNQQTDSELVKENTQIQNIAQVKQEIHKEVPEPVNKEELLVLVIEDNSDLRTYINSIVSQGYKTILAKDGVQGERMAFEHTPDLIISDVMMPKKDGYALCNSLKNNPKSSHIPIIMLTAKAGFENKMEGLTQGADAYLTKPFKEEELMIRIKNLVDARKKMWDQFQSLDLSLIQDMSLQSVDDQFVQEVVHCIKENLDNEMLGVEDISRCVGFSRSQLHRKLKAVINKSANQLIIEIRMNEARRMLEQNVGNVSEVAYSVGYSNLPYFTKSFKKQFGVLPSKVGM